MFENVVYVVGDKFTDFDRNNNSVITLTALRNKISENRVDFEKHILLVPGQGVGKTEADKLLTVIKRSKCNITFYSTVLEPIDRCYVHKRKHQNVLISKPYKIGDHLFSASLLVGEDCSEMSDHMTGQHIQGMVLMEAARQILIAVPSLYYIDSDKRNTYTFLFKSFIIDYHSFVFPIPVRIDIIVDKFIQNKTGNMEFNIAINFYQSGKSVTSAKCHIAVSKKRLINKIEAKKAQQALELAAKEQADAIESNGLEGLKKKERRDVEPMDI